MEARVLEYLAIEGLSYREIARVTGYTTRSVEMTGWRMRTKVGARTNAHAVHLALAAGFLGTRRQCGTRGGVGQHERHGEELCIRCRIFWRPYRADIKRRARERSETETKGAGRVRSRDGDGSADV